MAKVQFPLLSVEAQGQLGKLMVFRKGGVVSRYFKPRDPKTPAQLAHRQAFKEIYMAFLTQAMADLLYSAIDHLHDGVYSLTGHEHPGLYAALSHTHSIRDEFINSYPTIFKDWRDLVGFTAAHVGTGSFAPGISYGIASTGTTINSKCCLYSSSYVAMIGYGPYLVRFRTRLNVPTLASASNIWIGLVTNPTNITVGEHQASFNIVDGLIYASCGNGTSRNRVGTGVTIGQYSTVDLEIKELAGSIQYFVDGVLKVTFTTLLPNSAFLSVVFSMTNTIAAQRQMNISPYWWMQGA